MATIYSVRDSYGSFAAIEAAAFLTLEEAKAYLELHPESQVHSVGGRVDMIPRVITEDEVTAAVLCEACEQQAVSSKDPERYPYCRNCFYTGSAHEHENSKRLAKFRQAFPGAEVNVNHTGGGCFMTSVRFPDMNVDEYYGLTDGEACMPEPGEGWGWVGYCDDRRLDEGEYEEGFRTIFDCSQGVEPTKVGSVGPGEPIPQDWIDHAEACAANRITDERAIELIRADRAS